MAQLIVKRGPTAAATTKKNILQGWDDLLHSLWLEKMADNPELYDDATIDHSIGRCPCHCTTNLFLMEAHRRE